MCTNKHKKADCCKGCSIFDRCWIKYHDGFEGCPCVNCLVKASCSASHCPPKRYFVESKYAEFITEQRENKGQKGS